MLLTLCQLAREAHAEMLDEGMEPERAKAVATYLGLLVDRIADSTARLCTWDNSTQRRPSNTYARQALPMTWDFSEANPFGGSSGDLGMHLEGIAKVVEHCAQTGSASRRVIRGSATELPLDDASHDAVITDPPYYDNISYADLSDFFYVWLKRSVGHLYPEHLSARADAEAREAIAAAVPPRRQTRTRRKAAYEAMMAECVRRGAPCAQAGRDHGVRLRAPDDRRLGDAHRGGAARRLHRSPRHGRSTPRCRPRRRAGHRLARLVDLPRRAAARVERDRRLGARGAARARAIVRERVETLAELGITGTDLVIAAIGAGMRAYTRFARVEKPNGEELAPDEYLDEVQREVAETILARIFGTDRGGLGRVDQETQFYVMGRFEFGDARGAVGRAEHARPRHGRRARLTQTNGACRAREEDGQQGAAPRLLGARRGDRARPRRRSTTSTECSGSRRTHPSGSRSTSTPRGPTPTGCGSSRTRSRDRVSTRRRPEPGGGGLRASARLVEAPRRGQPLHARAHEALDRRRHGRTTTSSAATSRWRSSPPTSARSCAAKARCARSTRDPRAFFRATYLTSSMRALLEDVLGALSGGGGDRVLQLRTPFGGGKTHTLLALYHLATARDGSAASRTISTVLPDPGADEGRRALRCRPRPVLARDRTTASSRDTMWGELAWQLGGAEAYGVVASAGRGWARRRARTCSRSSSPRRADAAPARRGARLRREGKGASAWATRRSGRRCCSSSRRSRSSSAHTSRAAMVYSLQKSVLEAAGDESLLLALDHLVTRVDAKREPVTGDEVMRVVQRRLFADLGSEESGRRSRAGRPTSTAATGGSSPTPRRSAGTPTPKRTASPSGSWRAIRSIPRCSTSCTSAGRRCRATSDTRARCSSSRRSFTGSGTATVRRWRSSGRATSRSTTRRCAARSSLRSAIARDTPESSSATSTARTPRRRRSTGGWVATSRGCGNCGSARASRQRRCSTRSAGSRRISEACSRASSIGGLIGPDLDRNLLTTALADLRDELLFLHHTGRRYWFDKKANLNQLLATEANRFSSEEVIDAVRKELERRIGAVDAPRCCGRSTAVRSRTRSRSFASRTSIRPGRCLTPSERDDALRELFERRGAGFEPARIATRSAFAHP